MIRETSREVMGTQGVKEMEATEGGAAGAAPQANAAALDTTQVSCLLLCTL